VRWDPAVLSPELVDGAAVRLVTTAGAPPTIYDRAGGTLFSEQVVTLVNLDASADPAAVAPLLAPVAPTITAESLAAERAKAPGQSLTAVSLREDDLAPIEQQLTALPGVALVPQSRLLVADRALASPVWSGLVELWEQGQAESAGWVVQRVEPDGTAQQVAGETGPEASDLSTTIDPQLQIGAEAARATLDPPAVIAGIEPSTGAVRTIAQNAAADREGPLALTGLYPPGSTFKVVTTSAALQAGLADPDTVLPCPGVATIEDRTIPGVERLPDDVRAISTEADDLSTSGLAASALQGVVSMRLVPRADKPGRIPACEVLINTQTVRDQIRDMDKTLNIPDLIKEGTVQYGMQSFDQSLMHYYSQGIISYESAVFYATSPSEFALRVQGVAGTSDNSWSGFESDTTP
jgi:hypothetical protein